MAEHDDTGAFCAYFHRAVELIGRRWTGAILRALLSGADRFGDIATAIPGLSDRMLSQRLKELEAEGIVVRTVTPEMPVRIEYHLTPKGRALGSVLDAVAAWAHDWLVEPAGSPAGGWQVPDGGPEETEAAPDPRPPASPAGG
jgi:DNA-binding HxlR family transcriptional regulator